MTRTETGLEGLIQAVVGKVQMELVGDYFLEDFGDER